MRIDKRCLVCPIGPKECVKRIVQKVHLLPRKLRPAHPWTIEWCPYLRGYRPSPELLQKAEEYLKQIQQTK